LSALFSLVAKYTYLKRFPINIQDEYEAEVTQQGSEILHQ